MPLGPNQRIDQLSNRINQLVQAMSRTSRPTAKRQTTSARRIQIQERLIVKQFAISAAKLAILLVFADRDRETVTSTHKLQPTIATADVSKLRQPGYHKPAIGAEKHIAG